MDQQIEPPGVLKGEEGGADRVIVAQTLKRRIRKIHADQAEFRVFEVAAVVAVDHRREPAAVKVNHRQRFGWATGSDRIRIASMKL